MPNLVNRMIVSELTSELEGVEGMLMVSFGGLTVEESEGLRSSLAAKGVQFRMIRNSLARRVLSEQGIELDEHLAGNTAIAYGSAAAAIHAAHILTEKDVKKAGKVKIKAGLLDGRVLNTQEALALADIPDRDTLHAQLVGVIAGPLRGLAMVLNATPSGLARVLQARSEQPENCSTVPGDEPTHPIPPKTHLPSKEYRCLKRRMSSSSSPSSKPLSTSWMV